MAVEMFDYLDDIIALETASKYPMASHNANRISSNLLHSFSFLFARSFHFDYHIPCEFNDIGWPMSIVTVNSIDSRLKPTVRFPS